MLIYTVFISIFYSLSMICKKLQSFLILGKDLMVGPSKYQGLQTILMSDGQKLVRSVYLRAYQCYKS